MVSKLKGRQPNTAKPSKPFALVYGKPGVGKTWASLEFPKLFYIDVEGGANLTHYTKKMSDAGALYFGLEDGAQDLDTVTEQVQALATEKHDRGTLVIDSLSKLWNIEFSKQAEKLGDKNGFGADKKATIARFKPLMMWLERLDMNRLLLAHEKAVWENDKQSGTTFDGHEKLGHELNLILNIRKIGPARKAFIMKSRLEAFPENENFPWSYREFSQRFGVDIIEAPSEIVAIATPEQVIELNRLVKLVNLPQATLDKWLSAAKADTVDQFTSEQAAKAIAAINNMVKGEAA